MFFEKAGVLVRNTMAGPEHQNSPGRRELARVLRSQFRVPCSSQVLRLKSEVFVLEQLHFLIVDGKIED